ncbi:three-Cys-motif partner protein TcmP [Paraburkholderia kururiensis]|uniref:three-Cys-motif partner protein TcmP n=1 Tax=Paraburkholderia kururiensis TaxID=984307 RepID=UPI0005AA70F5|nr:three-Cys-motif partner protein TcmP [Paraburkholderia kururiensis]
MAKTEDKYQWQIGAAPPVLDQHSAVKHSIIESYVSRYIETVMSQAIIPKLTLSLVDGFAGGGEYLSETGSGSVDGTPLLMLRAAHEARAKINVGRTITPREVDAEFFFVEKNKESAAYLHQHLAKRRAEGAIADSDYQRVQLRNSGFLDELPHIVARIKARRNGCRSIFLLDQYSYRAVPMRTIRWLMSELPGAEVILNFNVGSLMTFLSDSETNRKPVRAIDLEPYIPWERLKNMRTEQDWRTSLQRHLAHGIKVETRARFMTLFFVRPQAANSWSYWLVHLSQRYKAHDVMKALHWEHSSEFGHELEPGLFMLGYNPRQDEDYSGQSSLLFDESGEQRCVDALTEQLGRQLADNPQPITVAQLFAGNISNTMADESRLQKVLRGLHSSGSIVVSNKNDRPRRPSKLYVPTDVIEHSRQIILT